MRFIESIRYKDGSYHNLTLHQKRLTQTVRQFMPGGSPVELEKILPPLTLEGTYKVRLVYDVDDEDLHYDIEYSEYIPRKIQSLQLVASEPFDYSYKYEDRSRINAMVNRGSADDIIITMGNKITDGSYFNLVFWDGRRWLTPDTPLLNGIKRQQLLHSDQIKEAPIIIDDLDAFEKVSLINSMLDLQEVEVPVGQIKKIVQS